MKRLFFCLLMISVSLTFLLVANCVNPDGTGNTDTTSTTAFTTTTLNQTSLNVLPSRYFVSVPKSFKSDSSVSLNSFSKVLKRLVDGNSRETSYTQSYGFIMIKETIKWLESNNLEIAKNFVLVDAAIKDLTPSLSYNESADIVITQKIVDTIKGLSGIDETGLTLDDTETIPTFKYLSKDNFSSSGIDASVDIAGFDFCVMLDFCKEYGSDLPYFIYVMWSSDKTLTKIMYDYRAPSSPYKMEVSYDSVNKISNMIYASESYPWVYDESLGTYYEDTTSNTKEYSIYNIKMQQKNEDKNGVMVKEISKYTSSGVKTEYIIEGYADDNGGYCETVVTTDYDQNYSDLGLFGSKITDKYREQFDANGVTTGWQFYNDDPSFGSVGWEDFDLDGDGSSEFTWSDTEYDDSFESYETGFEEDLTETAIDDTVNEYTSDTELTMEAVLPGNLTWDTDVGESKKTFVITSDNNPPKSNGENVIGYQTLYKVDYNATGANNITFNIENTANGDTVENYKIFEVENNVISLTGTASDPDYGNIETTKIVNLVVKGVVEITKTASGIFQSASSGFSTIVAGTTAAKFQIPTIDASKWNDNETAKLLVITSDKKPPLPDGSNVLGTKVVPKNVFSSTKPSVDIPMSTDSVSNDVGMYVYPQGSAPTSDTPATYDITTPDNPDTIDVVDANGDGEYENNESPDDTPDEDAPDQEEDNTISAPTGVTASTLQASAITIKWNVVTDADGYRIYYSDGSFAGKTNSLLFQDTSVSVGVETGYYVVAFKIVSGVEKIGDKSIVATGRRAQSIPVPAVAAGEDDTTGINVTLSLAGTEDDNIESFEIWRKIGDVGEFSLLTTLPNDKASDSDVYKDTAVEKATKYYYKVISKDEDDKVVSDFSIADAGEMKPFSAPTGVIATTDKSDMVVVSWNAVTGAKDYEVYRSDKGKNTWEIKGTFLTVSYEDKTCVVAKEYDYVVIARITNPLNESPKSEIATGKLGSGGGTTDEYQTPSGTYYEVVDAASRKIVVKCTPVKAPEGWTVTLRLEFWSNNYSEWRSVNTIDGSEAMSAGVGDTANSGDITRYRFTAEYYKSGQDVIKRTGTEITVPVNL